MPRVLIVGGDSDYNVGDAAILHAVCTTLSRACPSLGITIISRRPDLVHPPGVTRVLPKGVRFAAVQLRAAREQDMVLVGGGGLLQDDDSRIKMPYWTSRLVALRLTGPVIAGHCIGAGPLHHRESRALARVACSMMSSITVRDEIACRTLQACTSRPVSVVPDPAFMLEPAPDNRALDLLAELGIPPGRPLIGVAMRRWFHKRGGFVPPAIQARMGLSVHSGRDRMQRVVDTLGAALSRLARRMGADILFMPSYLSAHESDEAVCRAIAARMEGHRTHLARISDPSLYKAVTGQLRLLVSGRMHPLILAAGMGVPMLGIGYNSKFSGCMDSLGIGEHLLWFDDLLEDADGHLLERRAIAAMTSQAHVPERAAALAARSRDATIALLDLVQ